MGKKIKSKKSKVAKQTFPGWLKYVVIAALVVIVILVVFSRINNTNGLLQANSTGAQTGETTSDQTALPSEVTPAQAAKLVEQGAFLLDVREVSEWTQWHIQGATLIPLGELPNRLDEIPQDQKIVVYCRTGNRSAEGRDILLNAGFPQVTSMSGGITAWQGQGNPVVSGE